MFLGDDKLVNVFSCLLISFLSILLKFLVDCAHTSFGLFLQDAQFRIDKSFISEAKKEKEFDFKFYFIMYYNLYKIEIHHLWWCCVCLLLWFCNETRKKHLIKPKNNKKICNISNILRKVVLQFLIWIWPSIHLTSYKLCRQYINMTFHFC